MLFRSNCIIQMNYEHVKKVAKICHFVGAGLLVFMAIMEFTKGSFNVGEFFLNVYYILFGILIALVEIGFERVMKHFYFMKFSFGKAFFAVFIAILCFGSTYWARILCGVFFSAACVGFVIIGFFFRAQELAEINENQPNADPAKPQTDGETAKPTSTSKAPDRKSVV